MGLRKADRQLLVVVGIVVCLALVWWFGRGLGQPETPASTPSAAWTPASDSPVQPGASGSRSGTRAGTSATRTSAPGAATPDSGLPTIAESELPRQARDTLELIRAGGPYPYAADGDVFENRERILPGRQRGYYREYTVETPGSDDRGARRIVSGAEADRYYTDDHYDTFRQIEEGR